MNEKIDKGKVREAVSQVKHPAIDTTLAELGIVKQIEVTNEKAVITLAFPFPNIPIEDILVNSVKEPVEEMGWEVEVRTTVMNEQELQRFLALEKENWKG